MNKLSAFIASATNFLFLLKLIEFLPMWQVTPSSPAAPMLKRFFLNPGMKTTFFRVTDCHSSCTKHSTLISPRPWMDTCSPFANKNFIDIDSNCENHSRLPVMCADAPLSANHLSSVSTVAFVVKTIAPPFFSIELRLKSPSSFKFEHLATWPNPLQLKQNIDLFFFDKYLNDVFVVVISSYWFHA